MPNEDFLKGASRAAPVVSNNERLVTAPMSTAAPSVDARDDPNIRSLATGTPAASNSPATWRNNGGSVISALEHMKREERKRAREDKPPGVASGHVRVRPRDLSETSNTLAGASASVANHTSSALPSHEPRSPEPGYLDDFEFTAADLASIDEVLGGRGNTTVLDNGKAPIDAQRGALPALTVGRPSKAMNADSGMPPSSTSALPSHEPRSPEPGYLDDFEFTAADLASIDEVLGGRGNTTVLDNGKAPIDAQRGALPALTVGRPSKAMNADSGMPPSSTSALPSHEPRSPEPGYLDDFEFTAADLASIDEVLGGRGNTTVLDNGKAPIDAQRGALPALTVGRPSKAKPQAVARLTSGCIELGDEVLIGRASTLSGQPATLFETRNQSFRRTGKWPTEEELDLMSVLIKISDPEGTYIPRPQLYFQLGQEKYAEVMDKVGLSHKNFSALRTSDQHFYDTPAGRRSCSHNYEFTLQAGTNNPDMLIKRPEGHFIGFWPKLFGMKSLAEITEKSGVENAWLKAADNTYMTQRVYNLAVRKGAEEAFAKFIARDDVTECNDVFHVSGRRTGEYVDSTIGCIRSVADPVQSTVVEDDPNASLLAPHDNGGWPTRPPDNMASGSSRRLDDRERCRGADIGR
ncbi:hypothetical protein [Microvirga tunisiensis]|uniref:hypothetical protein n=1 Tax=Microvirga tunisiensis TaxID=2108360 RepID=UPI00128D0CC4|nr:hypothetical protein [Microvirga tunisiensis]MPR12538.1 hypothetical protein [Microvirga tunisiensis]